MIYQPPVIDSTSKTDISDVSLTNLREPPGGSYSKVHIYVSRLARLTSSNITCSKQEPLRVFMCVPIHMTEIGWVP